MNKICLSCGIKLQSDDEEKLGYVPLKKIEDAKMCMRCFRMQHYGENKEVNLKFKNDDIVNKINKENKFVIFLTDFLNINEQIIELFKSIKSAKMLVINKCELLPKNVNRDHYLSYVKNYYEIDNIVKIKGGNINHGAKSIYNYLIDNNIKEAYLVGTTNSGKSTLINDLLKICNSNYNLLTVNSKKNTTLDFLKIKIDDNLTIFDSPGFIFDNLLTDEVSNKDIVEYAFNMKKNEVLSILEKKYFIKFLDDSKVSFFSNYEGKNKKYFKDINLDITIDIKENEELVINGIGFIRFKNKTTIKTNINSKYLCVRKSFLGEKNE